MINHTVAPPCDKLHVEISPAVINCGSSSIFAGIGIGNGIGIRELGLGIGIRNFKSAHILILRCF